MKAKLKIGIIGCGRISVMHFTSAKLLPQSDIVACCDIEKVKAEAAAAKYGVNNVYTDYREMLDKEELDAVHLCLPHYLHVPVAEYAFSKGVNVLSEKPMAISYDGAVNCVEAADKAGVLYGVILQCRYNDASVFVKERIGAKLGKIISARSVLTWSRAKSYYDESDWKGTWEKEGGGVVIDQAIHSIDLVNWFIGDEYKTVGCSFANRNHPYLEVEDTAEGFITYKNGTTYAFYCMNNYGCDEPIEIRLLCENGKATLTYDDAYIVYNDGTREECHQKIESTLYDGAKIYWGFQHIKQIEQFYNACLGKEKLEISGKEALKTHKLLFEIYNKGLKNFYKEGKNQ